MKILMVCPHLATPEKVESMRKKNITLLVARNSADSLRLMNENKVDFVMAHLSYLDREVMNAVRSIREEYPEMKIVATVDNQLSDLFSFLDEVSFTEINY